MAVAGKVHHWKHGWIPISPEAKASVAKRGPSAASVRQIDRAHLQREIEKNGGFTYDPKTGGLLKVGEAKGFAIAVPGTEEIVGEEKVNADDISREDFAKGVAKVLMKHRDRIAKGAVLGGWYSPERNQYLVELSEIFPPGDREAAIKVGKRRNQEAIFDLATGETIVTGGTGDARPDFLPTDFPKNPTFSTFVATPSPEEVSAAKYYTGPGYKPLNGHLRFGEEVSPAVLARMSHLDSAISKSVVEKDTTVYRGVQSGSWLPRGLAPGTEITDAGYVSTAIDPEGQYGGDTKMIIRVPKGSRALDLPGNALSHHPNESELLLPRGTRLRVLSDVEPANGQRVITAEVVQ